MRHSQISTASKSGNAINNSVNKNLRIEFNEARHEYRVEGVVWPSVTQVLDSMGLFPQYPAAQRDFYLARGAAIHLATGHYDNNCLGRYDDRLHGFIDAWKNFRRDSGFTPTLVEYRVASPAFQYVGTTDRVGLLDGQVTIIDLKAGEPPVCAALQTAAYRKAYFETDGVLAERRLAVRLSSDAKYSATEYRDHTGDERYWLYSLSLYRWKQENL